MADQYSIDCGCSSKWHGAARCGGGIGSILNKVDGHTKIPNSLQMLSIELASRLSKE